MWSRTILAVCQWQQPTIKPRRPLRHSHQHQNESISEFNNSARHQTTSQKSVSVCYNQGRKLHRPAPVGQWDMKSDYKMTPSQHLWASKLCSASVKTHTRPAPAPLQRVKPAIISFKASHKSAPVSSKLIKESRDSNETLISCSKKKTKKTADR